MGLTPGIADTRETGAAPVLQLAKAVATTLERREKMALAYETIADGKMRNWVTAGPYRFVAERLRRKPRGFFRHEFRTLVPRL
ncbi:MAG: hypothetical protein CFE33_09335 [Pseudorhodobacter sp. PARRP1]|nr:MAG: hypothetical protein CFE33_09335 [Pseudorhodobacter sp. PARRP1]